MPGRVSRAIQLNRKTLIPAWIVFGAIVLAFTAGGTWSTDRETLSKTSARSIANKEKLEEHETSVALNATTLEWLKAESQEQGKAIAETHDAVIRIEERLK